MATQVTPQLQSMIDGYLTSCGREIRRAVDLTSRCKKVDEIEQIDLAAEWGLIMDFCVRLLTYGRQQQMNSAQQHQSHEARLAAVLGSQWATSDPPESWFT